MDKDYKWACLNFDKDTGNKLRWKSIVSQVAFKVYIPKTRVPDPCPNTIGVIIAPVSGDPTEDLMAAIDKVIRSEHLEAKHKPIIANFISNCPKTETMQYDPVGDDSDWEIGSTYIPYSHTFEMSPELTLIVFWRVDSAREFIKLYDNHSYQ